MTKKNVVIIHAVLYFMWRWIGEEYRVCIMNQEVASRADGDVKSLYYRRVILEASILKFVSEQATRTTLNWRLKV
jgi:hypothetical protein